MAASLNRGLLIGLAPVTPTRQERVYHRIAFVKNDEAGVCSAHPSLRQRP